MFIPLAITIAAAVLLLVLFGGGLFLARRFALEGVSGLSLRGWRWYPSPIAVLVLAGIVALFAVRFFPAFIFIPFVLPFLFRRGRGGFGKIFRFPGGRRDDEDDTDDDRRSNGNGNPRRPPWS